MYLVLAIAPLASKECAQGAVDFGVTAVRDGMIARMFASAWLGARRQRSAAWDRRLANRHSAQATLLLEA